MDSFHSRMRFHLCHSSKFDDQTGKRHLLEFLFAVSDLSALKQSVLSKNFSGLVFVTYKMCQSEFRIIWTQEKSIKSNARIHWPIDFGDPHENCYWQSNPHFMVAVRLNLKPSWPPLIGQLIRQTIKVSLWNEIINSVIKLWKTAQGVRRYCNSSVSSSILKSKIFSSSFQWKPWFWKRQNDAGYLQTTAASG